MNFRKKVKYFVHSYVPFMSRWFFYGGAKVFFPKKADIFFEACRDGIYEQAISKIICDLTVGDTWFFDVGANIGLLSVSALYTNARINVVSFEPSMNSLPYLEKTRRLSKYADRWIVVSKAITNTVGTADFYLSSEQHAVYDGLVCTKRVKSEGKITVNTSTIDEEWKNLNRPKISMIKIDIEGGEINALKGAGEVMKINRPFIIIEHYKANFEKYGFEPSDILSLCKLNRYHLYSVSEMAKVCDKNVLRLLMSKTASFIMVPEV